MEKQPKGRFSREKCDSGDTGTHDTLEGTVAAMISIDCGANERSRARQERALSDHLNTLDAPSFCGFQGAEWKVSFDYCGKAPWTRCKGVH